MADAETPSHYAEAPALQYEYTDGKALMEHGPEALHEHVASRLEIALGKALPQMEVRFKNLSLSAEVLVSNHKDNKKELPTLVNKVKMACRRLAPKKYMGEKHILKNVNGVFKPGTVTLILGQPGSGKSSLMKILSGRFPMDKNVTFEGDVTYNGATRNEIMKRMPQYVSYVTQRDFHFPTLTVKETLEFAHECCGGELSERAEKHFNQGTPEENKQALEAARALYKYYPEVIIHQLGLDNCQNTIVGNGMLRGVSGGERKRVTTGEMQFGNKYVTFMDEISTGLDSAATYDIIKTQRSIAKTLRKTVVIALLQPSPEVFALFDDVMILNDGYVMYHGPREQIMPYFEDLGFQCPPRRDAADYLMDLGTHQQHQYEVARSDGSKHPRKAREFAEIFEKSAIHDAMLADLHGPHDPMLLEYKENHFDNIPEFHQSFLESTATLIARQLKIVLRNKSFIRSRSIMVLLIGFIYSTVFWQFDVQNAQVVMGIIFQTVLFLALGQASQIPTYIAARQIFYKQRASNFYRTASYVLACSFAQLPLAAAETIVFGTMVYWMCGFVTNAGAYILFELLLFLTNLAFGACFFLLAAIAPDLHVAKPMSMVAIMIFVLFAGFVVPANQIPDYLIWIYWLNPISWCVRAVGINEYRHAKYDQDTFKGINYKESYGRQFGAYSLSLFDVKSGKEWLAYGFIFLICSYFFFMWLSYLVLEYIRYESPEHITLGGEDDVKEVDPLSDSSSTGSEYGLIQTPRGDNKNKGELAVAVERATRERYFKPVTLTFKDLRYSVPNPTNPKEDLELLKGISGFATPGTITALMGSSGAGKTTLMDVIAGRKTGGKIQGKILLNGHEATDLAIRRTTGYCEQMDIHSEAATIREALTFSAFLRQDASVSDAQKYDSVEEVLELLDMLPIADQIIRGSSVEQMKRLTIGVELAAQPCVLFLDEPTSGLDARSAKVIMDGVRKVADSGRTIVCTIHQPSSEVFSVFDSLLLLKRGGETVYFGQVGENASELTQYFESIPGTPHLPENYNPATWMLEVTGAGVGNAVTHDFVQIFNESEKKKALDLALEQDGFLRPAPGVQALEYPTKRAALESVQAKFLIQRFFAMYWRTPSYNLTRFVVYILQALIFGLAFAGANYASYQGINAGEGMVFMTSLFLGVVSFNSILPLSCEERPSFYRERAAQTYNALWYFVGATVVEIPYVLSSTLVYNIIFFPMVGFTGVGRFFSYWIVSSLMVLIQAYIGQLLAFALPSVETAAISGVMVNSIFFLFMGFNPPASAIPKAYKWLYYITPHRYGLSVLSAIVFGDCPDPSNTSELGCKTLNNLPPGFPKHLNIKGYVEKVFDIKYDDIWMNLGILIGFIVFFRLLAAYALRYINHQKR